MPTDTTRPEAQSQRGLIALVLTLIASLGLVGGGLLLAHRHRLASIDQEHRELAAVQQATSAERGALFVTRSDESLIRVGPDSPIWDDAPALSLALQRQNIAMPMLDEVTIPNVSVQGITDGSGIALRLSWEDPVPDANVDTGRFSDAVALQFPLVKNATFSMGDRRLPVQILHWKALWQKDVDEHFQDVQDLHPNYWTDLYWFADGSAPYRVPDSFDDPRSRQWFVGQQAGNPVSDFERVHPVEELAAEGYGSLTTQDDSVTRGRGIWLDGRWYVVFARPLQTEDPLDYQFWSGAPGSFSVAVWDGAAGNVGGRKQWSNWTELEVSY